MSDPSLAGIPEFVGLLVIGLVVYSIGEAFYNLFLHPLAKSRGLSPAASASCHGVHAKYGEVVRIAPNEFSFANQDAWTHIFAKLPGQEQWPRHPKRVPQGKNGPQSIMNTSGNYHARFRRLLNHAFSEKGLQEQQGLITKYIDLFINRVGDFAQTGETVDITKWLGMVGFDVISDLGWSEPFNCVEKGEVHEWMKTFVETAFDSQMKFLFREHGLMWLAPYFVPKYMQLARLKNFKYARSRVEERIRTGGIRDDFWDKVAMKSADDNAGGEGLTKEEMIVAAVTLVGTGSETISTLLTGLVYFLGRNPHAMKKLVDEIRTSFASPDEIDFVSVHKLKYMTACLEETMRLYPPVITMLWRTPPKGGGSVSGLFIPEGRWKLTDYNRTAQTGCNISFFGIAQNPAYFHRPDDFCPERFVPNPSAEFASENHEPFHPFSIGAYNCIGQNLANAESRLILTKMLWHYNIRLDERTPSDWLDQRSYGVFIKKVLHVQFSPGKENGNVVANGVAH
ncbi:cytochrome P450 [Hypomontagnella monticulosa]|nr:cytochrome P450 [Hypomontagnella monticulosa]